ncbi:hypothetical protein [Mycolicibacterium sediminis]|uniref:DUF8174 domain-containing protein n=1 Tax=Mycolicibacterium sediminis TaxID=1286180 RepID=A0A7I7QW39_9MYCO|nr:hypothetical protein [Mycolicibacterium sediminis]BBY30573.1 hypothetical protein MSEDJ_46690 [Mycolicibacterium sediminis]
MAGPFPYPESSPQNPYSPPGGPYGPPQPYPEQVPAHYPGALPPPVPYPKRSRRRPLLFAGLGVLVVLVVAALVTTLVMTGRSDDDAAGAMTPDRARGAIQAYVDALTSGDDETIARNASCGLFDEIKDRQADMSLANLASDAFRRQYKGAEVSTIDKIVEWSPTQSQVLFTMKVQAARTPGGAERQAVAQILTQGDETLVCSYLPRTGQY